eukprot:Rhum_TRINITY_DN3198_c0_g2::Rhum_TRINITY_DN3198_c0_g2_i1::g.9627::m.9627/K06133/LYS5, acpT; 4'-phosphopantetheinyl transferase
MGCCQPKELEDGAVSEISLDKINTGGTKTNGCSDDIEVSLLGMDDTLSVLSNTPGTPAYGRLGRKKSSFLGHIPSLSCLAPQAREDLPVAPPARWYVDVSEWRLSGEAEYQFLLGLIGDEQERVGVEKYRLPEDRQRALVSRLLARKVSAEMCGLAHNDVSIQRTRGGKPFLSTPHTTASQPNFNFNISHDGDFVVLASEPTCLVGVDVVAPREKTPNRGGRDALRKSFTYQEQAYINGHETECEKDRAFGLLWSCKEAYIKARGDGLKFELTRANFFVVDEVWDDDHVGEHVTVLRVEVDNVCLNRWTFHSSRLPNGYIVTVAKGPSCDAVDPDGDFTHGFTRGIDAFTPLEWTHELDRVQAEFVKVPVGFLVPEPLRAKYEALGAEPVKAGFTASSPVRSLSLSPQSLVNASRSKLGNGFGSIGCGSPRSKPLSSMSFSDNESEPLYVKVHSR